LFQLRGKTSGDVVAISLDGRLHLGGEIGDVVLVLGLFALQQSDIGLYHGDALIHPWDLVIHVADVLLQDQLGILAYRDEKSYERPEHSSKTLPHKGSFCLKTWGRASALIRPPERCYCR